MKQYHFDYILMIKGELYYDPTILPENKSTKGKVLAQKINQLAIDNVKEIVTLEKELLVKKGKELYITPPLYVHY
ncbi:sugar O-acetyltransferase, partial [Enterococcus faecalis]